MRINFLFNLKNNFASPANIIFYLQGSEEFINLCTKYDISYNSGPASRSCAIWQHYSLNIRYELTVYSFRVRLVWSLHAHSGYLANYLRLRLFTLNSMHFILLHFILVNIVIVSVFVTKKDS